MRKKIGSWVVDVSGGRVTAKKYFVRDSLTVVFVWRYSYEPSAKILYDNIKNIFDIRNLEASIRKGDAFFGKKVWK